MIEIRARLGDGVTRIEVTGHEGGWERGVVCAAITAITSTAVLGLREVALHFPDLVSVTIETE